MFLSNDAFKLLYCAQDKEALRILFAEPKGETKRG